MLEPFTGNHGRLTLTCVTCLATLVACGPGSPPELRGLSDQVAQVGTELMIGLNGTDPDGDDLAYQFRAADLTDLDGHADITESPSGAGVFRWTPMAADVGRHAFDFTVSDAAHTTTVTISIDVRSAIGAASAPVFRQPLGSGTTLDLANGTCIDLDIVVDDQDSATVKVTQSDPVIEGAELRARDGDGHMATWHWCPTREQQAESRYTLTLTADDGDNPRTIKNYLIVLRGGSGTSCPGAAPMIAHTAHDVSSIIDVPLAATVTDDKGVKDAPLLYYAMTAPATPPDLSKMTQLTTRLSSGDARNGVYSASVANPVAQMPAGTRQTLYYVFVASDDDDATGTCDHSTTSQVYTMAVTSTGTADLPICAACTSDAQCGGNDECVRMGATGATFCLQACGTGCPTGTTCSTTDVTSVDGKSAPQCVPNSGTCEMSSTTCADDSWEVNDTRSNASSNPTLTPDSYNLVSCPSTTSTTRANDDWFKIVVASDQRVDLRLAGGPPTDLDLHLYHSDGTSVTASTGLDASEDINLCLPAATYYVKVNGYGSGRNPYSLAYTSRAESCTVTCQDDSHETDDSAAQARVTTQPDFVSTGNKICPDNDDWYKVPLITGDIVVIDLAFTQSTSTQDLDIHVYKSGVDLTPCDVANPQQCSVDNGQSGQSNEHAEFLVGAGCELGCDFDVVVRGYNHSSNSYGIAIGIF
jgi:hypothetical protein